MTRDRLVQIIAPLVLVLSLTMSGVLLPRIVQQSDEHVLRYTNVSVEGAPPFVVIGTAIGAVRGLIVDYLWIKANAMKERGLFYEAMADADLITKLQPRFSSVWAFHGHNMAYNISVATNTWQERWEWVNAGIRLVRNQGLRYNPNDLALHRELAFWFAHKIEGVADDAHLFYKREICREWHLLLGPPPDGHKERVAWIKEVADAPETLVAAEQRTPGVMQLVDRLRTEFDRDQKEAKFKIDKQFLSDFGFWQAVKESPVAKIMGYEQNAHRNVRYYSAFDAIFSDAAVQPALKTLVMHARKRVLKDEYNMDPALMYRYTADLGPIDWRHGSAHSLYWSRRGSEFGSGRLSDYDIYISLNNDSQQVTSMQDLARSGRISYDPFSMTEMPGRFPEPQWIEEIFKQFDRLYVKWYDLRGAGGDRFVHFLQNFMGSAICEWYRSGETQKAQAIMDRLAQLFAADPKGMFYNSKFKLGLREFVYQETFDQYQAQPHLAPRDVSASLRYGLRVGILSGRSEVLRDALVFASQVTTFFKNNSWNDHINMYGVGRIRDLIGSLEDSADLAYLQLIVDPGTKMSDRISIWANTDRVEGEVIRQMPVLLNRSAPLLRALVYDRAKPSLEQQFQANEISRTMSFDQAFPPPPGLENARQFLLQRQQDRDQQKQDAQDRDPFSRTN